MKMARQINHHCSLDEFLHYGCSVLLYIYLYYITNRRDLYVRRRGYLYDAIII